MLESRLVMPRAIKAPGTTTVARTVQPTAPTTAPTTCAQ
jgi:hypothetical protein